MITIKLDGYSGKPSALVAYEHTATGVTVYLHEPLASAVYAMQDDELKRLRRKLDAYADESRYRDTP